MMKSVAWKRRGPITIKVEYNDSKISTIIDTGAGISCISEDIVENVNRMKIGTNIILKGISNKRIKVRGETEINFKIGAEEFNVPMVVVRDLAVPMLLGVDFCAKYNIKIDFKTNNICTHNNKLITYFCIENEEKEIERIRNDVQDWKEDEIYLNKLQHQVEDYEGEIDINLELNSYRQTELELILKKFADRIAWRNDQMGRSSQAVLKIDTGDSGPIHQRPYRGSHEQRKIIEEQVDEMLANGVIRKSSSPWSSPVVLVKKRDGKWRFCVDYRQMNKIIRLDKYPLPRIDDLLSYLSGAEYFASLDMLSGYWQIPIEENDKYKTAFVTINGLYEFNVLPFGLATSGACFQRMVDQALGDIKYKGAIVYIDDILVYGKTFEEFCKNLEDVLMRLRVANLSLNPKKCRFGYEKIEVLGHQVNRTGIRPTINKVEAIKSFPKPKCVKDIRSFIGMASFYRKFIKDFALLATPLTELTKKSTIFKWEEKQEEAFNELKEKLCKEPVLKHFEAEKYSEICVDASNYALGAYLSQKDDQGNIRPVFYASRRLSDSEKKLGATQKECLAIVWAVEYFRHYIWGTHFLVISDCRALKWLMKAKDISSRFARWALRLQEYDFEIQFRRGCENKVADALSRNPFYGTMNEDHCEEIPTYTTWSTTIEVEQERDDFCNRMKRRIQTPDRNHYKGYFVEQNILYRKTKVEGKLINVVIIPENFIGNIIEEFHDNIQNGAHLGIFKTLRKLRSRIWCKQLAKHVERYIKKCQICQRVKGENKKQMGYLEVTGIKDTMERLAIDVVGPLVRTRNDHRYIFTAIDYATKWAIVRPYAAANAEQLCEFINDAIINVHGVPKEIITDKGSQFTSHRFKKMMEDYGIRHILITTAHPASNGLIEKFNGTLKKMIIAYLNEQQNDWDTKLQDMVFSYNTSVQCTTGHTPFKLLYGREPRLSVDSKLRIKEQSDNINLNERWVEWRRLKRTMIENINKRQRKQKEYFDRGHRKQVFKIGDLILIKDFSKKVGLSFNLQPKFKGPYKIIRLITPVIYEVKDVNGHWLTQVHVQDCKRYVQ